MEQKTDVEQGIPLPEQKERPRRWPFAEMAPGDSFLVEGGEQDRARLISAMGYEKRRSGRQFTTRQVGPGQWRCWRLPDDGEGEPAEGTESARETTPRRRKQWRLPRMAVGTYMDVEGDEQTAQSLRTACSAAKRSTGGRWQVKKQAPGHWRCWRVR